MSERTSSDVAIENGHVTNRTVGGCGSNLGLSVLKGTSSAEGQFGYYTRLPEGRAIPLFHRVYQG